MTLLHNTEVVQGALDKLKSTFKEKATFQGVIEALAEDNQEFEDSLWILFEEMALSTAVGARLDIIGQTLAVLRLGRSDTIYRTRLQAAIIQYMSSGRWEQLLEGFRLLTGSRSTQGEEIFPAAVSLTAIGASQLSAVDLAEVVAALRKLKAAGVRLNAALVVADPPFVFGGDPDPLGQGFADENNYENTGGYFPLALNI